MTRDSQWDLVIIGAGPAGSAAALAALAASPGLRVLLLDRSDFPRDKACGDGIAPHVLDLLSEVGVSGLLDDLVPVRTLELQRGRHVVTRQMARPAWVVPRLDFDARLLAEAIRAGAVFRRQRVRGVVSEPGGIVVDGGTRASVVVGADGANSLLRKVAGLAPVRRRALALRGYGPTPDDRAGRQVIVFGEARQPSYAWSFDRGDGLSNVGYGELPGTRTPKPTRQAMLARLEELLPGSVDHAGDWLGHHLPLSSWTWHQPHGRILLAGDAAGLINPMTGEGIYYAVATGVLAGRVAATAIAAGTGTEVGVRYRAAVRGLLGRHLKHTSVAARLVTLPAVVEAGIRAAARDQQAFDALVEIGLGQGLVRPRLAGALVREVTHRRRP